MSSKKSKDNHRPHQIWNDRIDTPTSTKKLTPCPTPPTPSSKQSLLMKKKSHKASPSNGTVSKYLKTPKQNTIASSRHKAHHSSKEITSPKTCLRSVRHLPFSRPSKRFLQARWLTRDRLCPTKPRTSPRSYSLSNPSQRALDFRSQKVCWPLQTT